LPIRLFGIPIPERAHVPPAVLAGMSMIVLPRLDEFPIPTYYDNNYIYLYVKQKNWSNAIPTITITMPIVIADVGNNILLL